MYTGIIIDDEPKIQKVLEIKLKEFCPEVTLVATAVDVPTAYDAIIAHKPNLISVSYTHLTLPTNREV